ncbi:MAG: glucan biosynthesis glucosyltransferase H, partial [Halomonas sp.]|nr:glucan biosynthesis glucosyltransferase H [Halomonas sp.]
MNDQQLGSEQAERTSAMRDRAEPSSLYREQSPRPAPTEAEAHAGTVTSQPMPALGLRRFLFFTLTLLTTVQGGYMMFDILRANGLSVLELSIWLLFVVMFAWLSVSFWTGIAGFLVVAFKRDPLSLKRSRGLEGTLDPMRRVALVMPVYNEDTERVIAGLEATCRSLIETGQAAVFDVFLLSDTTDDTIAAAEKRAAAALRRRLGSDLAVYYRRRERNVGRKVGNLKDFCCRWGQDYESMIVLDADSVMGGRTLVGLAATMQA